MLRSAFIRQTPVQAMHVHCLPDRIADHFAATGSGHAIHRHFK
ncbi:hypothetical protein EC915_102633 [Pseudomonas sp. LP_7_YM]|nr:hypothetical protein EC915_102633 [Pseudomonas sp. LP_7_YM]